MRLRLLDVTVVKVYLDQKNYVRFESLSHKEKDWSHVIRQSSRWLSDDAGLDLA